jgi:cytochrome P450
LPERWDPTNPLFLTPDGKKRNPFSFIPFSGGKRVCFGKTFAEAGLKYFVTYLTQLYDMDFCPEEALKYKDRDSYPVCATLKPVQRKINVRFTKRV